MAITFEQATARVLEYANDSWGYPTDDDELVIFTSRENDVAWLMVYNTRSYATSRDPMKSLLGNGPVVVSKSSGAIQQLASGLGDTEVLAAFANGG